MNGITGMNYGTGSFDPIAVPVDLTITFHAPKRGHYCFPAAQACGELVVTSIGIKPGIAEDWRAGAQCAWRTKRWCTRACRPGDAMPTKGRLAVSW